VPEVTGPLRINVVYPQPRATIESRDSNFVFGSVGNGNAGLTVNGVPVPVWPNGAFMGWVANPPATAPWYDLVAFTPTDTARLRYPVRTLAMLPPRTPQPVRVDTLRPPREATIRLAPDTRAVSDTDDVVIGRPTPTGTYKWFLFPGTRVRISEWRGDMARVLLDSAQAIWMARASLDTTPAASPAARTPLMLGAPSITPASDQIRFALSAATPPAYLVEEDGNTLALTLYDALAASDTLSTPPDSLLRGVAVTRTRGRAVYRFTLARPVYGYLVTYENGALTLSIRRPPVVQPDAPLRGQTIVVDPGHPPIGATGPTGLWEPVATLAVGLRVRDLLQAKGANVVMTRTGPEPVALEARPVFARRANPAAFVSIHLNALADGQNPFRSTGTGTYYFHPQSKPLADAVQAALVPQLGLYDRGVFFQNLAVCRPTWFPAVLAEGLFVIMPDQEAAIRTPEYQEAYARGVVDGLERYFATLAR
jgi:N-acetylmuramoyl-L-alanine amidase